MIKRGSVGWLIWNLVLAACLLAFGILNLVFNDKSDYQAVIIMIIGIFVVLDAAIRLLANILTIVALGRERILIDTRRNAIMGSLELAIGISIIHLSSLVKTYALQSVEFFFRFVGDFFGIAAIVLSAILLIYGIILAVKTKRKVIDIVFIIIGAAILATAGILVLVYLKNENVLRAFFIFFGIAALLVGLMLLGGSILVYRLTKAKAGQQVEVVAEVQVEQTEDKAE